MTKNKLTRCLRDTGQTELRRLVDVTRHKSATILLLRATQVDVCLQQLSLIKQRLLLSKAGVSPQPGHVFHPVLHRLAVGQRRPVQPGRTRGTRCWVSSHNTSTGSWMGFTLGCGSGFAGTTEVCFMISFKHGRPRMFQSRLHQPTPLCGRKKMILPSACYRAYFWASACPFMSLDLILFRMRAEPEQRRGRQQRLY